MTIKLALLAEVICVDYPVTSFLFIVHVVMSSFPPPNGESNEIPYEFLDLPVIGRTLCTGTSTSTRYELDVTCLDIGLHVGPWSVCHDGLALGMYSARFRDHGCLVGLGFSASYPTVIASRACSSFIYLWSQTNQHGNYDRRHRPVHRTIMGVNERSCVEWKFVGATNLKALALSCCKK